MKRTILIVMAALLVVSSLTACGNKSNEYGNEDYSRVLYDDNDEEGSEENDEEGVSEDDSKSEDVSKDNEDSQESKEESKEESTTGRRVRITSSNSSSKNASNSSKAASSTTASSRTSATSSSTGRVTRLTSSKSSTSKANSSSSISSDSDTYSNSDVSTDSSTDTEWYNSDLENTDTNTVVDTDSEIEKGTLDESDMYFPVSGGLRSVGQNFETADNILGGFNTEEPFGEGKLYSYNECTIKTAISGEEEYITNITITSSNYSISKDIRVGSTSEDLLKAFGDADYGYTYTYGIKTLNFVVIDDVVIEISFS